MVSEDPRAVKERIQIKEVQLSDNSQYERA